MIRTRSSPVFAAALALATLLQASTGAAQYIDPFRTQNMSPLVSIIGLPSWDSFTANRSVSITSELANHYRLSRRAGDVLILDGETWRNNLYYGQSVAEDWFVTAEKVGDPDLIRFEAESFGYFGVLGGSLELLPEFGMKAQIDVHTGLYETPLEEIGQTSVQATIGG